MCDERNIARVILVYRNQGPRFEGEFESGNQVAYMLECSSSLGLVPGDYAVSTLTGGEAFIDDEVDK